MYAALDLTTRFRYCVRQLRAFGLCGWGGTTLAADWTIREILKWTRGYFEDAGIVQPRLEAEMLLAHALEVDRLHLYVAPDKPLTLDERSRYRSFIQERKAGTPLQHLIGEVSVLGLRFRVNGNALIPRPETEELLDRVLQLSPRERKVECLDLGTGSGIIAVCLARYLPNATVTAVDISPDALDLARENAALNAVTDRITFIESDWFEAVNEAFDLIVANPPYIPKGEIAGLPAGVRNHEPLVALDGGAEGVHQMARMISGVPKHLRSGGRLFLEIGHDQGGRVLALLEGAGMTEIAIDVDLSGKERFAVARCP